MKFFNTLTIVLFLFAACEQAPSDMALIPAGEFVLGFSSEAGNLEFLSDQTAGENARPSQRLNLEAFYIDRKEVTYGEFLRFKPQAEYKGAQLNEPIRGISWYEADAYCLWRGKRLPTEFEWEKAARGTDERLFVWGNEFHKEYANLGKKIKPVRSEPQDVSPFGIYDMNGNVSEWTADWYKPYPNSEHKDESFGETYKVIRGGSLQKREHGFLKEFAMLPYRNFAPPTERFWDTGFRCAK